MERQDLLRVGASMKLDTVAAELTGLLARRDAPCVLLKGTTIARRLYDDETRPHDDVDVLVREHDLDLVRDVLRALGFERAMTSDYAEPWIRSGDGVTVDLHTTLAGVGASHAEAWDTLSGCTVPLAVGGREVRAFDDAALALHIALHAAQHGDQTPKSIDDLERALERFPDEAWERGAELARRLDAVEAFGAGLRLVPAGEALAARLDLPTTTSTKVALLAASAPPTAIGIYELTATPGVRAKAALVAREVVPAVPFMRAVYPIARRGPLGLAAAYAWRPFWLALHVPAAVAAVRRARRASSR